MKNKLLIICSSVIIMSILYSCKSDDLDSVSYVIIETEYGDMKVELYDDTPKHKKNFVKLVIDGFYDNLLFHRVIEGFMIQGGDPDSKSADPDKALGSGGPGYTIDAEIQDKYFHKKGALVTARKGDNVNPEKKSSGSQFYITQGKAYTDEELDQLEDFINNSAKNKIIRKHLKKNPEIEEILGKYQEYDEFDKMDSVFNEIMSNYDVKTFKIPDEKREVYKKTGGVPNLDGDYTVFGEVIEGLEVIDKIAAVKIGERNRPVKNIKMRIKIVE